VVRVVVRTGSMIPSMPKGRAKPQRSKGRIETLPSGSLRVTLYAGTDPITKNRMYQRETVPAGPNAEAEAKRILAGSGRGACGCRVGAASDRAIGKGNVQVIAVDLSREFENFPQRSKPLQSGYLGARIDRIGARQNPGFVTLAVRWCGRLDGSNFAQPATGSQRRCPL
jgi:hypothetical protein